MLHLRVYFYFLHFVLLLTIYVVEHTLWLAVTRTLKGNRPKYAPGANESVVHIQIVFVVS